VYLIFTRSTEDAQVIFRDAGEYNMTGEGHVWIVTEQALFSNNTPDGVLGLQLEHAHSDKGHIRVSAKFFCSRDPKYIFGNLVTNRTAFMFWRRPSRR